MTDYEDGFAGALAYLRSMVPTLPESFGLDPEEPLFAAVSHGDAQAVVMAALNINRNISRDAFLDSTSIADVAAWVAAGLTSMDNATVRKPVERPRGSYATKSATLRPVIDQDAQRAYITSLDPRSAHRWRFRGRTPAPEEFHRMFFTTSHLAQLAVVRSDDRMGPAIGVVSAYDADLSGGHCYIAFQRLAEPGGDNAGSPDRGLMIEGLLAFIQYLFDHFTLRKIYAEVPEYNLSLLEQGASGMFEREGTLRDHYYFGDRYWDSVILALYRARWDELSEPFRGEWPEEHRKATDS